MSVLVLILVGIVLVTNSRLQARVQALLPSSKSILAFAYWHWYFLCAEFLRGYEVGLTLVERGDDVAGRAGLIKEVVLALLVWPRLLRVGGTARVHRIDVGDGGRCDTVEHLALIIHL